MTQTVEQAQFYELNMGHMQEEAEKAGDSNLIFGFPTGVTEFFLLPPWSQRGLLAKTVYQTWIEAKKKSYTSWKTYENEPGWETLSRQDPFYLMLKGLQKVFGNRNDYLQKFFPRAKLFANAIILSVRESKGERKELKPKGSVVRLPKGVYDYLAGEIVKPNVGSIVNPHAAVCVVVERSGEGLDTRYKASLAGNMTPGKGFTPFRENLFEKFGEAVVTDILKNLTNLDGLWPPPNEAEQVQSQQFAEEMRQFITSGSNHGSAPAPAGAAAFGVPGAQIAPTAPGAYAAAAAPTPMQQMVQPSPTTAPPPPGVHNQPSQPYLAPPPPVNP